MRALWTGLLLATGCGRSDSDDMVGSRAPDFTLSDASGIPHTLHSQKGSVVVLDLTAMWCPTCRKLAPTTQAVHERFEADGVVVWTIIFDDVWGADPGAPDLMEWASEYGITHPVLGDEGKKVYEAYGEGRQPVGIVVGPDLVVEWVAEGSAVQDHVEGAVDDLLSR